jgi:hypothetical protein
VEGLGVAMGNDDFDFAGATADFYGDVGHMADDRDVQYAGSHFQIPDLEFLDIFRQMGVIEEDTIGGEIKAKSETGLNEKESGTG